MVLIKSKNSEIKNSEIKKLRVGQSPRFTLNMFKKICLEHTIKNFFFTKVNRTRVSL